MNRKRILLVDDDESLVKTFQLVLENDGFSVETASTGGQALQKAEKNEFQLAILDIKLPDIAGDELAKTLKKQRKNLPIVLITGYSSFQECINALDLGVHEILLKPIPPAEILRVVNEALEPGISVS